jgi:hypothetical protein
VRDRFLMNLDLSPSQKPAAVLDAFLGDRPNAAEPKHDAVQERTWRMTVKKAHGCMMVSPFAGAGSNSKGMFLLPRTKTEALGTCEAKEIRVNKGVH